MILSEVLPTEVGLDYYGYPKELGEIEYKYDPKTEMFPWNKHECQLEINPASQWGKVLLNLKLQPKLICHVPNLQFKFSEPLDQNSE